MRRVVTMLAMVLLATASLGQFATNNLRAAPPKGSIHADQLNVWLSELDDEDYARREAATERLHAAGDAAIDVLAEGALSTSPEAAWRAGEALKRIAISGNERTIDRVATALERVGKEGRQGITKVVAEIRARQKQMRHDRAAALIRRHGGGLSGGMDGVGGVGGVGVDFGFFLPMAAPMVVEVEEAVPRAGIVEIELEAPIAELKVPVEAPELPPVRALEVPEAKPIAGEDLEAFRELERVPPGAEEAVEEAIKEAVPVEAVEALVEMEAFAVPAGGMIMLGGLGDVDSENGVHAEALMLDANWRGGDKGLEVLRDLPDVTSISIEGASLTDAALKPIALLPRLTNIEIRGTIFSVAALRELHRAKPNARLFCQGEAMVGIHADRAGSCELTSVYPGSGAADAGLAEGDRIVAIDGVEVRDFSELTISVYGRDVGDKLKMEYERDGKQHSAEVELKARSVLER